MPRSPPRRAEPRVRRPGRAPATPAPPLRSRQLASRVRAAGLGFEQRVSVEGQAARSATTSTARSCPLPIGLAPSREATSSTPSARPISLRTGQAIREAPRNDRQPPRRARARASPAPRRADRLPPPIRRPAPAPAPGRARAWASTSRRCRGSIARPAGASRASRSSSEANQADGMLHDAALLVDRDEGDGGHREQRAHVTDEPREGALVPGGRGRRNRGDQVRLITVGSALGLRQRFSAAGRGRRARCGRCPPRAGEGLPPYERQGGKRQEGTRRAGRHRPVELGRTLSRRPAGCP